jgi:hypothetical protein
MGGMRSLLVWPLLLALAALGLAGDHTLSWWTMNGGGDTFCAGANLELSGTIGQPDAGVVTGGNFELLSGFWPGVEEFCVGDLDDDRDVDLADLAQLLSNYGTTSGARYEDGDLDGDGDVDLGDLAALLAVYGTACD